MSSSPVGLSPLLNHEPRQNGHARDNSGAGFTAVNGRGSPPTAGPRLDSDLSRRRSEHRDEWINSHINGDGAYRPNHTAFHGSASPPADSAKRKFLTIDSGSEDGQSRDPTSVTSPEHGSRAAQDAMEDDQRYGEAHSGAHRDSYGSADENHMANLLRAESESTTNGTQNDGHDTPSLLRPDSSNPLGPGSTNGYITTRVGVQTDPKKRKRVSFI
jgi:hypothetical protein